MRTFIDDNYGTYEITCEEDVEFYRETQAKSVWKRCNGCGRKVKIKPDYAYCNSCATKKEQGWDI